MLSYHQTSVKQTWASVPGCMGKQHRLWRGSHLTSHDSGSHAW